MLIIKYKKDPAVALTYLFKNMLFFDCVENMSAYDLTVATFLAKGKKWQKQMSWEIDVKVALRKYGKLRYIYRSF